MPECIPLNGNGSFNLSLLVQINTDSWTTVADNHDLRFVFDGIGVYYTLTRSISQQSIVCEAYDFWKAMPPRDWASEISYDAFDSYDAINRDHLLSPNFSELSFTYSIQAQGSNSYDVWVGYFNFNFGIYAPPVTYNVTGDMPHVDSQLPSIAADSVINGQSGRQGVLVAWDTRSSVPGYPITHRVESNRFRFPSGMQQEFPSHLILANGLSAPSYPDIARVIGNSPMVSPTGVVVWEGGGELGQCTPARPTENYSQYVVYDRSAANPGIQWPQAEMVGPGTGNYHQTRPMVD